MFDEKNEVTPADFHTQLIFRKGRIPQHLVWLDLGALIMGYQVIHAKNRSAHRKAEAPPSGIALARYKRYCLFKFRAHDFRAV